jgi:hypothetical protein
VLEFSIYALFLLVVMPAMLLASAKFAKYYLGDKPRGARPGAKD